MTRMRRISLPNLSSMTFPAIWSSSMTRSIMPRANHHAHLRRERLYLDRRDERRPRRAAESRDGGMEFLSASVRGEYSRHQPQTRRSERAVGSLGRPHAPGVDHAHRAAVEIAVVRRRAKVGLPVEAAHDGRRRGISGGCPLSRSAAIGSELHRRAYRGEDGKHRLQRFKFLA